jgi:hypothetical protein
LIARYTGDLNALILAAVLQIVGIVLPVAVGGLIPTFSVRCYSAAPSSAWSVWY